MPSYQHHRVSFLLDGISNLHQDKLAPKNAACAGLADLLSCFFSLVYCTGFSSSLSESPTPGSIVPSNSTTTHSTTFGNVPWSPAQFFCDEFHRLAVKPRLACFYF